LVHDYHHRHLHKDAGNAMLHMVVGWGEILVPMDRKTQKKKSLFAGKLAAGEAINRRNGTSRTKTSMKTGIQR
jgi:hypothetical protein